MFSFFKKKNKEMEVPDWASPFDSSEYSLFIKEINNYFEPLNIEYQINDGYVVVKEDDLDVENLGLGNIAQLCKLEGKGHYKDLIKEHFDSIFRANKFYNEFLKIEDNFEEVKKYIGVRLYGNEYFDNVGKDNVIGRDFVGDILSMVVYDFPDCIRNVNIEQLSIWNKSIDELMEIGISNIKEKHPITITKESLGDFNVWFVETEHFYASNVIFDIENRKELIGSKGALIGFPNRHIAIIYPIENEVEGVISRLIPLIYQIYQDGPGSVSNCLFWYKDGIMTELPYQVKDNTIDFLPPKNFIELLKELS